MDTDISRAVGPNVVLVGSELATLGGDALQLLLGRRIRITDLHQHALFADRSAVVFLDDIFALFAGLEPGLVSGKNAPAWISDMDDSANSPSKPDTTAVAHAVAQDLAGDNMVTGENGIQFLERVRRRRLQHPASTRLTDSFKRFGRFDRYRLVDVSSPSALSLALKLSWEICQLLTGHTTLARLRLTRAKPTS
jgi:hypothetical protein